MADVKAQSSELQRDSRKCPELWNLNS